MTRSRRQDQGHGALHALDAAGLGMPGTRAEQEAVAARYAVGVTPYLVERMRRSAALARQFAPSLEELDDGPTPMDDPIGDTAHSPVPGIVHRYPDRVLLMPLAVCPAYCRFCFRRARVGRGEGLLPPEELEAALAYIRETPAIWEVILTGGDPMALSPARLARLMTALGAVPHVKVVRLHTRLPVVDPERLDAAMVGALLRADKTVYVAVHCNHADELTPQAKAACARLAGAGIPLVGQTVLLRGVNDTFDALAALMRAMVAAGIKPYYLHHLDFARGTEHFRVPLEEGRALVKLLRARLSGLCQPAYVVDIPGGYGKVPVAPTHLHREPDGSMSLEDHAGRRHPYPG